MHDRREEAKREAKAALDCLVNYVLPALGAVAARSAIGAVDGAIGFEIAKARNTSTFGYTLPNTVASQAIGGAILSPISMTVLYYLVGGTMSCVAYNPDRINENVLNLTSLMVGTIAATLGNAAFGLFDSLLGAAILGLYKPNPLLEPTAESNFAAAAGTFGGGVTALGIFAGLLLARSAYLLSVVYNCQNNNEQNQRPLLCQFFRQRADTQALRTAVVHAEEEAQPLEEEEETRRPLYLA